MTFVEITHPDENRLEDLEVFRRMIRGELPEYGVKKRCVRKDDRVVRAVVNASVIRDEAGGPLQTGATIQDMTERKRTEEERKRLLAREQAARGRVSSIPETISDAFYAVDNGWHFTYLNR